MTDSLKIFLEDLCAYQAPNTTNLYRSCEAVNCHAIQRKANLEIYLSHFITKTCSSLLIGEAPGYKGCRVTGISFTSEYIIENNPLFFSQFESVVVQHRSCQEYGATKREASATIVWEALTEFLPADIPCCWNIFPWHPFNPNKGIWSNRTPTEQETEEGSEFTKRLIELLQPEQIIAVGKTSCKKLMHIGIDAILIRHPANGGKSEFRRGIAALSKGLS